MQRMSVDLFGPRSSFELPYDAIEALLLRLCDDEEFHTHSLRSTPADCSVFDRDWVGFPRHVKQEAHLHAGERIDQAFHPASLD